MNDYQQYNFRLEVDKPERVDKLISNYLLEYSRSTIQKWITNNEVLIDGQPCSQKDKIRSSCDVSIKAKTEKEINLIPEKIEIDIIDETDDYIVVNKKSGMVTHIAPGNFKGTLQNALFYKYPELAGVPRTGIIHRLDKDTSGILVIARNLSSHNNLNRQLQNNKFDKTYHALIVGNIQTPFNIEEPIGRHPVNRKKMTVTNTGKYALSKIKLLDDFEKASHIQVQIITGRTHQIRAHLSHINRPVIGDKLYGFKKNIFNSLSNIYNSIDKDFSQYLHSYSLSFYDPKTNNKKIYKATYPDKYLLLLNELEINKNDKEI
tara:strand:- start:1410 stop:2366 length:957 start_codon:yes stop_codon:yes gene_type:complete